MVFRYRVNHIDKLLDCIIMFYKKEAIMNLLYRVDMGYDERRRVVSDFFIKMRAAKQELNHIRRINRLQRSRCRSNLLRLEELECEFHRVEHIEDIDAIFDALNRYLYLNKSDLIEVLAKEEIKVKSLFLI